MSRLIKERSLSGSTQCMHALLSQPEGQQVKSFWFQLRLVILFMTKQEPITLPWKRDTRTSIWIFHCHNS